MSRFVREAKSASGLNHPNIITIHEIGESEEIHYIATEFIDGKTLNEYAKDSPLNNKSMLDIAIQVASALDEAHQAGIIHRDIKPDNIMVRKNGLVKILDFGIAKLTATPTTDTEAATAIQSQTQAGMIIGTPNYMSPEQARGKVVDQQTDIFSFGVVLYEMLSGNSPFQGETVSDVIAAVLTKEPERLIEMPAELEKIVHKTLQKDKQERYQTVKDLLSDLREVKQELEFRKKLEQTSSPDREEQQTQILKATTTAEDNRKSQIQNLKSVVVLPFSNIGADAEEDYFSDGLTEEVISDLSKIRSLHVISRNSAMKLKGTEKDLKTIAEELNVQYVLDGSVRKAGDKLRISVQLIDGATDANLWAEKYNGSLEDIFDIQESVSRSIAEALQITLTTGEIKQIEERPIADAQAYDLYLRARTHFQKGNPEALDHSIELLKQGLDLIGDNELLYAALGYTYYFYFRWVSKIDENYLRLANECMEKTFAIDPDSSHGFSLKGNLSFSEGDIAESIRSLQKAVELQPANTEALLMLSLNNAYVGRIEDSLKYSRELYQLDPVSSINTFMTGVGFAYKGEFSEALIMAYRALEMNPTSPLEIWSVCILEAWGGKFDKAIAHADQLAEIAPGWVYTEQALFLKHALLGEKELALQHYTPDFDKEAKYDCHFALHIAHCFALIGEKERALDFLTLSVRNGMLNYTFIGKYDSLLENIRDEQRFKDLIIEAKRRFEEIYPKADSESQKTLIRGESATPEEPKTQILKAATEAENTGKITGSEEGFRVAVLPFKYRGGSDEIEALAEGLSEEIVTGLSRFPYLRVISRSMSLSGEIDTGERANERRGIWHTLCFGRKFAKGRHNGSGRGAAC